LEFARTVSGSDYERDEYGILARLEQLAGAPKANLVWDLLYHAHAREWSELHQRLGVVQGQAVVAAPEEVAPAMLATANSESFITFDDAGDLSAFFEAKSLADWMLFLHPEQKKVAERNFRGPARLRGVSGIGKTCVLVHRARYVAKKYRQPVLLMTLTESMRKLLEQLADDLCGVERGLIFAMTMSATAKQVVHELHPRRSMFYTVLSSNRQEQPISAVADRVRQHADFRRLPLQAMSADALGEFLRDEIAYARSRLRASELDLYTDTQSFRRRGRGVALNELSRRVVLDGMRFYEDELEKRHVLDHEGIVRTGLDLLESSGGAFDRFRAVLCDEVQDLSQLEVALLGRLSTPSGELIAAAENGLFLVGDGAQTIYKRGLTPRRTDHSAAELRYEGQRGASTGNHVHRADTDQGRHLARGSTTSASRLTLAPTSRTGYIEAYLRQLGRVDEFERSRHRRPGTGTWNPRS